MKRIRVDKLTVEKLGALQKDAHIDPTWLHNLLTLEKLRAWAAAANAQMATLGLPRHLRKGATVRIVACGKMPDSYKYTRKTAIAKLEFFPTGCFLTSLQPCEAFPDEGGVVLWLTADQVEEVRERVQSVYPITL